MHSHTVFQGSPHIYCTSMPLHVLLHLHCIYPLHSETIIIQSRYFVTSYVQDSVLIDIPFGAVQAATGGMHLQVLHVRTGTWKYV